MGSSKDRLLTEEARVKLTAMVNKADRFPVGELECAYLAKIGAGRTLDRGEVKAVNLIWTAWSAARQRERAGKNALPDLDNLAAGLQRQAVAAWTADSRSYLVKAKRH